MSIDKEKIKNLTQANFYLESLGLSIRVGMDITDGEKKFFVIFPKTEKYLDCKSIWMNNKRD